MAISHDIDESSSTSSTIGTKKEGSVNEAKKELETLDKVRRALEKKFRNDTKKWDTEERKYRAALDAKATKENIKEQREAVLEYHKIMSESADNFSDRLKHGAAIFGDSLKKTGVQLVNTIANGFLNVGSQFNGVVNSAAGVFQNYQSSINARLQGTTLTFQQIAKDVRTNIGTSRYLTQTKMLDNLNTLISQGISYNVEQRAFLQSIKDDIATTFDVANGTLLRLIRIQQADTTAARLGLEAGLTQFFNKQFQDTSYLDSMFDAVSSSIVGASSQMTAAQATEFEYIVQKWLGSFGALGVSESTLSNIATGLNALGTGDVSALSGNTQLQNLMAMAMQRAGVSYSDVLTGGLGVSETNDILRGIAELLKTASESDNQVVRAQYASLLGVTVTDLTTIARNLDSDKLDEITKNFMNYSSMLTEVNRQITEELPNRLHISEIIKNVTDNFMFDIGSSIASSTGQFITWTIADILEQTVGGIAIPTISVLGSSVDLNTTVAGLTKSVLVGYNILAEMSNIMTALSATGGLDLSAWGSGDLSVVSRGSGISTLGISTPTAEVSRSATIGTSDESAITQAAVTSGQSRTSTFYGEQEEEKDYSKILSDSIDPNIASILTILQDVHTNGTIRVSFDSVQSTF